MIQSSHQSPVIIIIATNNHTCCRNDILLYHSGCVSYWDLYGRSHAYIIQ